MAAQIRKRTKEAYIGIVASDDELLLEVYNDDTLIRIPEADDSRDDSSDLHQSR